MKALRSGMDGMDINALAYSQKKRSWHRGVIAVFASKSAQVLKAWRAPLSSTYDVNGDKY